jgi:hypothetical protein
MARKWAVFFYHWQTISGKLGVMSEELGVKIPNS